MTPRIRVDRMRCCGAGMCALTAPEVFDQDRRAGKVLLLEPAPPPRLADAAREAAELCPSGAITVEEPEQDAERDRDGRGGKT
ncbi:ferredoxin [Streptomyces sp. URMC 126]|uniref:ferredoxin n=1 Tax=Streptomyces sp. URMC 126 TaxID=3423401 RepID=UPI003F1B4E79